MTGKSDQNAPQGDDPLQNATAAAEATQAPTPAATAAAAAPITATVQAAATGTATMPAEATVEDACEKEIMEEVSSGGRVRQARQESSSLSVLPRGFPPFCPVMVGGAVCEPDCSLLPHYPNFVLQSMVFSPSHLHTSRPTLLVELRECPPPCPALIAGSVSELDC